MTENKESKRFEEWEDCDCNQCEHYWDSSCDGVAKDTKKPCNQFRATRNVVIPYQIEDLQQRVKLLALVDLLLILSNVIMLVGGCFR